MADLHYTTERNVQILIALLKAHGIKRVVASPGTTNMTFVVSIQNDPWFQIWSSVDERSAAYLACGMASETGEPVVISCTGATASRNYMPGLTEAFYRKLPILALTSTRGNHRIGHLIDQQIDRRSIPNDIATESVTIPLIKDFEDERFCEIEINKAILAMTLNGGGPAHINLYTSYSKDFSVRLLPPANAIFRHTVFDSFPELPSGRIIVYVGSHPEFSERETFAIDRFCATHDAIVCCDHTSGYHGRYEIHMQLLAGQVQFQDELCRANLCIHIGEVSGDPFKPQFNHVWRVSPDGKLRDAFGKLRRVFMMPEESFFLHYSDDSSSHTEYFDSISSKIDELTRSIPELPFSNIWIAQAIYSKLPPSCELHLGILHSLRSFNFFKLPHNIQSRCNVGGFGIDGCLSTMIGASFVNPDRLFFCVLGDLAFFYDMNVVGNRHVGNNIRVLLINNGKGNEFRNYNHPCFFLGEEADYFVAAAHHYGDQSKSLVKDFAENLGYEYLTASNKEDFLIAIERFLTNEIIDRPVLLEVFTQTSEESKALELVLNISHNNGTKALINDTLGVMKGVLKGALGENRVKALKDFIKG